MWSSEMLNGPQRGLLREDDLAHTDSLHRGIIPNRNNDQATLLLRLGYHLAEWRFESIPKDRETKGRLLWIVEVWGSSPGGAEKGGGVVDEDGALWD